MAIFSTDQLIESYTKAIKLAKEFLTVSENTNEQIKETAKGVAAFSEALDTKTADGLKEFNTELTKTNKLVKLKIDNDKEAKKAQEDLLKVENALNKAIAEEEKANQQKIKTKQLIRNQEIKEIKEKERLVNVSKREAKQLEATNKAKKKAAEKTEELNTAYGKLRTQTNKAQLEFKQLAAEFGIGSKEAEGARKKFEKLDKELRAINKTAKDGRRDVGRYADGIKEAGAANKGFGISVKGLLASGSVIAILGKLTEGAFKVRGASLASKSAVAGLNATLKVFSSSLGLAIPFLLKAVRSLGAEFSSVFGSINLWLKETKLEMLELLNTAFIGSFSDEVNNLKQEISDLTASQKENNKQVTEGRQAWSDLLAVFNGTGERIEETKKAIEKLYEAQDVAIDRTAELSKQVAEYSALEQEAIAREGENAESLQKRILATEDAVKFNKLRTDSEVELAKEQLKIIKLGVEVQKAASGQGDAYKMTAEETIALTEATNALTTAQGEQATSARDNRAKLTQLALDIFEQEADFVLDGFENQKAINERKLENDNITLTEKKKILEEEKKAQLKQVDDLNEIFNKSLEDLGFNGTDFDLIKEQVDLQKLIITLREDGAKALLKEIQLLGGSEIANKQIFDRVREINTQLEDEVDNTETIKEKTKEIADLKTDILEQERVLKGMSEDEADEIKRRERIIELEKELQELEVEGVEEKTKKQLELEKELNGLRIEEQKDFNNKTKELAEQSTQFVLDQFNAFQDKKMAALDRELEQGLRNQDIIAQGIENGSKLGEQSLAQEKALQAEREAELKRLEAEALKLNALISLLQVWGDTGSLSETLAGFATIKNTANSVAGFYTGTDSVGSSGSEVKHSDGRDGYIAKLDKGEMVFNSGQSDELRSLGFTTRDSMLDLARMSEMGVNKGGQLVNVVSDNSKVVKELQEQNKLLKQLPKQMPITNRDLSDDPRYIEQVVKTGNIKTKVKTRARGTWTRG